MGLAATMLEDREFIKALLLKARSDLEKARRLAEGLLKEAGIDYHRKG